MSNAFGIRSRNEIENVWFHFSLWLEEVNDWKTKAFSSFGNVTEATTRAFTVSVATCLTEVAETRGQCFHTDLCYPRLALPAWPGAVDALTWWRRVLQRPWPALSRSHKGLKRPGRGRWRDVSSTQRERVGVCGHREQRLGCSWLLRSVRKFLEGGVEGSERPDPEVQAWEAPRSTAQVI
jgi:hypothetical protein